MTRSLEDARAQFFTELDAGTTCPCCDRPGKRYKRKLNSGMAQGLIWLAGQADDWAWVNIQNGPTYVLRGKQFATTAYWGLVERRPKRAGYYRLTRKGRRFMAGTLSVSTYVHEFRGIVERVSGPPCFLKDALTDKFDLAELMAATAAAPKASTEPAPTPFTLVPPEED